MMETPSHQWFRRKRQCDASQDASEMQRVQHIQWQES